MEEIRTVIDIIIIILLTIAILKRKPDFKIYRETIEFEMSELYNINRELNSTISARDEEIKKYRSQIAEFKEMVNQIKTK